MLGHWQFTPYAVFYLVAFLLLLFLLYHVSTIRHIKGKEYFIGMIGAISLWVLGYTLGFFSTNIPFRMVMLRLEYLGLISTSVLWLFFVASYTNTDKWLTLKVRSIILILPIVTYFQIFFFQHHDFYYQSYGFIEEFGFLLSDKVYGPGFYIWAFYSYALVLLGIYVLINSLIKMPQNYRGQILLHIIIVVSVLIPNVLYITGNNPIDPYDPICLSFTVTAVLYMYVMRRHRFLDIAPVAHNLVFKNVKSGVLIVNHNFRIVDANPSAEIILNRKLSELVGSHLREVSTLFGQILNNLYHEDELSVEVYLEQEQKYFELQVNKLTDGRGRDIGRILMFYDITIRKQALYELDAYARTVAHNLKDPMTSLCGFTELLSDTHDKEEFQEYVGYIKESSFKMNSIIDGLLTLSKIRSTNEVEIAPLDTGEVVNQVLGRLKENIEKSHASIEYPGLWPVALGHAIWVEEIWANYISNALKYGGDPPKIQLGVNEVDDFIKFWVLDNGPGISDSHKKLLFREFSRLEEKSAKVGFGLGLSIVKRIVGKMDGSFGVEDNPEGGSVFYFTLPKSR